MSAAPLCGPWVLRTQYTFLEECPWGNMAGLDGSQKFHLLVNYSDNRELAEWKDSYGLDLLGLCVILSCAPTALSAHMSILHAEVQVLREGRHGGREWVPCKAWVPSRKSFGFGHVERKVGREESEVVTGAFWKEMQLKVFNIYVFSNGLVITSTNSSYLVLESGNYIIVTQ